MSESDETPDLPPPSAGFVFINGEWCQLDGDDGE